MFFFSVILERFDGYNLLVKSFGLELDRLGFEFEIYYLFVIRFWMSCLIFFKFYFFYV